MLNNSKEHYLTCESNHLEHSKPFKDVYILELLAFRLQ